MDHPDPSIPQHASARRRLIRGALSAPALMTVCSGSAFAAASNMRCLANAANAATPPAAWGTPSPDTFLRAQLYQVTVCIDPAPRPADRGVPTVNQKIPAHAEADGAKTNDAKGTHNQALQPSNSCTTQVVKYYIKGSDLSLYTRGPGMPSDLQYLQIDNGTYATIGAPVPIVTAPPTILSEGYASPAQYVAVRFDSSGVLVGIGPNNTSGPSGMVGTSCWASAFPRP